MRLGLLGVIVIAVVATGAIWLYGGKWASVDEISYTYIGDDHPRTWDLNLERVHKATEDSIHYALDTPAGRAEWNSTLPSGGGLLYFGQARQPFSISMFHQLRCLDIIGRELDARAQHTVWQDATPLSTHCMNYLRQMALCRANTRLLSVRSFVGPHIAEPSITNTCNDWSAVYAAAEENYADFVRN